MHRGDKVGDGERERWGLGIYLPSQSKVQHLRILSISTQTMPCCCLIFLLLLLLPLVLRSPFAFRFLPVPLLVFPFHLSHFPHLHHRNKLPQHPHNAKRHIHRHAPKHGPPPPTTPHALLPQAPHHRTDGPEEARHYP